MRRNTKLGAWDVFGIFVRALTRALAIFAVLEVLTGISVERVLLHHPFAVVCIVVLLAAIFDLPDLLPDCPPSQWLSKKEALRKGHDEAPYSGGRSCRRRP